MVQLQLITAIVKLFLKKPSQAQDSVQKILQTATQSCDNPDIRDRAYIYWRLLSTNPQAAKVKDKKNFFFFLKFNLNYIYIYIYINIK